MKVNFPVPKVYAFELSNNQVVNHPFILEEEINGTPIYRYLRSLVSESRQDDINEIWKKITKIMVRLHNIDIQELSNHFHNAVNNEDPFYFIKHDYLLWLEIVNPHKVTKFFQPILEWLNHMITQIPLQKYSLVHRDIYQGNLLFMTNNDLLLLDWGVSYITDFGLDLGYTLMKINLDDNRTTTRDHFLQLYETLGEITVENIEFFEILATIKNIMIQAILEDSTTGLQIDEEIRSFVTSSSSFNLLQEISTKSHPKLAEILRSI